MRKSRTRSVCSQPMPRKGSGLDHFILNEVRNGAPWENEAYVSVETANPEVSATTIRGGRCKEGVDLELHMVQAIWCAIRDHYWHAKLQRSPCVSLAMLVDAAAQDDDHEVPEPVREAWGHLIVAAEEVIGCYYLSQSTTDPVTSQKPPDDPGSRPATDDAPGVPAPETP